MPRSDDSAIPEQVRAEIAKLDGRDGLTREKMSPYLVEPYRVTVRHGRRLVIMWVVLHETPAHPDEGYRVAFYPECNEWCLVEKQDADYVCGVVGERSLAAAWIDM